MQNTYCNLLTAYSTNDSEGSSTSIHTQFNKSYHIANLNEPTTKLAPAYRSSDVAIAKPVENTQEWLPNSNPPPFPDCSVVFHSSMVIAMPTSLTLEIMSPNDNEYDVLYDEEYYEEEANNFPNSACDDSLFLGQVDTNPI